MILAPYVLTLGVITYRWYKAGGQAPPPIALGGATVIFGLTSLVAHADERFGNVLSWAVLVGALAAPQSQIKAIHGIYGLPAAPKTVPKNGTGGVVIQQADPSKGIPQINQTFPFH